jgi:hypothetical protein
MPGKPFLSKSTFIRGIQCEKSFYLHKKRSFLRDRLSEKQLAKFNRGHQVGLIARDLYPGGVDVSPKSHFQMDAAIKRTAELIQAGVSVIYEASFEYHGVRVALDVLYKEDGLWNAVEVKSSAAISETYLWDAALQYYVITGSGLPLDDFSLAYINYGYVRNGEIRPMELFVVESVLDLVLRKQDLIGPQIEKLRQVNQRTSSPEVAVGPQCTDPYPCDFIGHCWKKTGMRPDTIRLTKDHFRAQTLKSQVTGRAAMYSSLCFQPAIPPYNGFSPYQELAYAFRLEPLRDPAGDGCSLVADPETPVSCEQLGTLIAQMKTFDSILVFDREAELDRLMLICHNHATVRRGISALSHRMVDIKDVFIKPDNLLSEDYVPENAEGILVAIGIEPLIHEGTTKSYLASAALFEGLITGEHLEKQAKLDEITSFHTTCLRNMEKLFLLTLEE